MRRNRSMISPYALSVQSHSFLESFSDGRRDPFISIHEGMRLS